MNLPRDIFCLVFKNLGEDADAHHAVMCTSTAARIAGSAFISKLQTSACFYRAEEEAWGCEAIQAGLSEANAALSRFPKFATLQNLVLTFKADVETRTYILPSFLVHIRTRIKFLTTLHLTSNISFDSGTMSSISLVCPLLQDLSLKLHQDSCVQPLLPTTEWSATSHGQAITGPVFLPLSTLSNLKRLHLEHFCVLDPLHLEVALSSLSQLPALQHLSIISFVYGQIEATGQEIPLALEESNVHPLVQDLMRMLPRLEQLQSLELSENCACSNGFLPRLVHEDEPALLSFPDVATARQLMEKLPQLTGLSLEGSCDDVPDRKALDGLLTMTQLQSLRLPGVSDRRPGFDSLSAEVDTARVLLLRLPNLKHVQTAVLSVQHKKVSVPGDSERGDVP